VLNICRFDPEFSYAYKKKHVWEVAIPTQIFRSREDHFFLLEAANLNKILEIDKKKSELTTKRYLGSKVCLQAKQSIWEAKSLSVITKDELVHLITKVINCDKSHILISRRVAFSHFRFPRSLSSEK